MGQITGDEYLTSRTKRDIRSDPLQAGRRTRKIFSLVGDVVIRDGEMVDSCGAHAFKRRRSYVVFRGASMAMAGGTTPDAALDKAKLLRRSRGQQQELPIDLKKVLAAKTSDVKVQDEDIVFVPNSAYRGMARRSLEAVIQMTTGMVVYRHY
jgi:hypothetical protein